MATYNKYNSRITQTIKTAGVMGAAGATVAMVSDETDDATIHTETDRVIAAVVFRRCASRKRGFVLLLTLAVLVLLATIIVQFQADNMLYVRTDNYRQEQLKCRYAAESAMVAAPVLIKEILREARKKQSEKTMPGVAAAKSATNMKSAIPPGLSSLKGNNVQDANSLPDRNNPDEGAFHNTSGNPFVLRTKSFTIDGATVELQIQDENAKWPLLWLLRPPGRDFNMQKGLAELTSQLGADSSSARQIAALTSQLGKSLPLPPAQIMLSRWRGVMSRRSNFNSGRLRGRIRTLKPAQAAAEEIKRRNLMGEFAIEWYKQQQSQKNSWLTQSVKVFQTGNFTSGLTAHNSTATEKGNSALNTLKDLLNQKTQGNASGNNLITGGTNGNTGNGTTNNSAYNSDSYNAPYDQSATNTEQPITLSDYLGCWGHYRININTAPEVVLAGAFVPLGANRKNVRDIINLRKKHFIASEGDLNMIPMNNDVLKSIIFLSTIYSDTFSVDVVATLGRVRCHLVGGYYENNKHLIVTQAVFPGD